MTCCLLAGSMSLSFVSSNKLSAVSLNSPVLIDVTEIFHLLVILSAILFPMKSKVDSAVF